MYQRKRGFTLLELMIVVIIVGILASLALPKFIEATRRAKESEAKSILGSIRSSQLRYYLEHDFQYSTVLDGLDLDLTDSKYYNYEGADAATSPTYIGKASAKTGSGLNNFQIDEDGNIQ